MYLGRYESIQRQNNKQAEYKGRIINGQNVRMSTLKRHMLYDHNSEFIPSIYFLYPSRTAQVLDLSMRLPPIPPMSTKTCQGAIPILLIVIFIFILISSVSSDSNDHVITARNPPGCTSTS